MPAGRRTCWLLFIAPRAIATNAAKRIALDKIEYTRAGGGHRGPRYPHPSIRDLRILEALPNSSPRGLDSEAVLASGGHREVKIRKVEENRCGRRAWHRRPPHCVSDHP